MSNFQELVELNLFQHKNFTTDPNQTIAKNTLLIGSVLSNKNNSFVIDSIPNNQFSVRILDLDNNISSNVGDYILQIHFEKIK